LIDKNLLWGDLNFKKKKPQEKPTSNQKRKSLRETNESLEAHIGILRKLFLILPSRRLEVILMGLIGYRTNNSQVKDTPLLPRSQGENPLEIASIFKLKLKICI
jgi:hypothetical protein